MQRKQSLMTSVKVTDVHQTSAFKKSVKRLKSNQKKDLDHAVKHVVQNPLAGERKQGDLDYLRVYKFKMVNQLTLLGYNYEDGAIVLTLMAVATHENFYRSLKR